MKFFTRTVRLFFIVLGAPNFASFVLHSRYLGGDAANGRGDNGHFYVSDDGKETEVSQQQWNLIRWHGASLLLTHPLFMGALFLLAFKHEFSQKIFRGEAASRARTTEHIRNPGPVITQFGCAGKIGEVALSAGFLRIEIYPAGLVGKLRFIGEFGMTTAEVESVEQPNSLLNFGVAVVHRSPTVVSRRQPTQVELRRK